MNFSQVQQVSLVKLSSRLFCGPLITEIPKIFLVSNPEKKAASILEKKYNAYNPGGTQGKKV